MKKEYKCLKCGKVRVVEVSVDEAHKVKHKKTCYECRRKKRLRSKANSRGKRKYYYETK